MRKKVPNPTDIHVGNRVRLRRRALGMSQGALAEAVGLTFQQIQKYENGKSRIGSSRLQQIAHALKVPVAYFFEDAPGQSTLLEHASRAASPDGMLMFLKTREGLTLARAFTRIRRRDVRRQIANLVETLSEG